MAVPLPFRVNCGGNDFIDTHGNLWRVDQQYIGVAEWGWVNEAGMFAFFNPNPIANTNDDRLYQDLRGQVGGDGRWEYVFEIPDGEYRVTLKTSDTTVTRTEDVDFNGVLQGNILLIASSALDYQFVYNVVGGIGLTIAFYNSSFVNAPIMNGIMIEEIVPLFKPKILKKQFPRGRFSKGDFK